MPQQCCCPRRDGMTDAQPTKRLLAVVKPKKPIGEMTDAERTAFAEEMVELAKGGCGIGFPIRVTRVQHPRSSEADGAVRPG